MAKVNIYTLTVQREHYNIDLEFPLGSLPGSAKDKLDEREFRFETIKKRNACIEILKRKGIDFRIGSFIADDEDLSIRS